MCAPAKRRELPALVHANGAVMPCSEDTEFEFHPLTRERWGDLVALFGPNGACGGCWCMYWRRSRPAFEAGKGVGNRRALQRLAGSGEPVGLLAYAASTPVGWCALAPRERYVRLASSRILAPVDQREVWAISCFFIARRWRRHGLSRRLIEAAVDFARRLGARCVEAYPHDTRGGNCADAFVWTGTLTAFAAAGFHEVARRSAKRPVVRLVLSPDE